MVAPRVLLFFILPILFTACTEQSRSARLENESQQGEKTRFLTADAIFQNSRALETYYRRLIELDKAKPNRGALTQYGELSVEQKKGERGPSFFLKEGSRSTKLFSFNEAFLQLGMDRVKRIRFCNEETKGKRLSGVAHLEGRWRERLVWFELFTRKWKELEASQVTDYLLTSCGSSDLGVLTTLNGSAGKYKINNGIELPAACIQATLEPLEEKLMAVRCFTGDQSRWFLFDPHLERLKELQVEQDVTGVAQLKDSLLILTNGKEVRECESVTCLKRKEKPLYILPENVEGVSLTVASSGSLLRVRQGDHTEYIFFSSNQPRGNAPIIISSEHCSLKALQLIGKANKLAFTCESRLSSTDERFVLDTKTLKVTRPSTSEGDHSSLLFAENQSGIRIPIRLLPPKVATTRTKLFLTQYSAYGSTPTPLYSPFLQLLSENGYHIAIAYLRGGGFYGSEWRESGRGRNKKNTVRDLITATKFLQALLKPSTIIGHGKSAGAWPYIASLTQQPGLFSGIILEMPVLSPVNQTKKDSPYYAQEQYEWGNPEKTEIQRLYMELDPIAPKRSLQPPPASYFRIALLDKLTPADELLPWIAEYQKIARSSPLVLEVSRQADHQGYFDRYQELRSMAKQFLYAELVATRKLSDEVSDFSDIKS